MNKLFTKIAALALGMTMATGVGVAVATSSKAHSVDAAETEGSTQTLTVTRSSFSKTGGYAWYDWTESTTGGTSLSGKAEIYATTTASMQFNKGKGNGVAALFNTVAIPGEITKIEGTTASGTNRTWNAYVASTAYSLSGNSMVAGSNATKLNSSAVTVTTSSTTIGTSTHGYSFFCIQENVSSASYISQFKITYTVPSGKTLDSIAVKTAPTKTTYYEGQTFVPTGLVITGTYSDESTDDISYADHSSDFSFTPNTSTALTTSDTSITIGYGGKTCSQTITVNQDVLNSVTVSGTMSTTSYTTADSWVTTGLVVTANYSGQGNVVVTNSSTIQFYKDSSMTQEVATPNALGVGASQTIYVKATYSGVSNTTGYSQTVSVTKAPSVQTATINLVNITLNDSHSQDATDVSITIGTVTFAWTKVSGSVAANSYIGGYNSRTQTRIYTGHRLTISAGGNTLKCVNFTGATGSSNGPNKMSSWTGGTLSDYDTTAGTATVTASNSVTSLVCTPSANTYLFSAEVQFYAADVPAEGITINGETSSSVSITPYQTTRLVASVLPTTATDRTFSWSLNPTGDDAIITIDETGHVEPISGKYGATVVTATSTDGGFTATCTVTVEHVSYYQAVYYPASTSSATTSGTLPQGESHAFSCGNYQSGYAQLTTNSPTAKLTLSGYDGQQIRAVLLKMHSNGSAGTGSLSVVAGETTVASISTAPFSDETWNGEYTTDWVLIEPDFTLYDVGDGEDIVITVTATVNSLYLSEVRIQYEPSQIDTTAVQFAQMILDDITCDNGVTPPDPEDWGVLVGFWDDGTTITVAGKQILLDAQAVEHETPSTDEETIQAAIAKYDYIIGKYNKTLGLVDDYPDFIERNPAPVGNHRIVVDSIISNSGNSVAIIIIVSVVSISAIGGYFFLRKKREN